MEKQNESPQKMTMKNEKGMQIEIPPSGSLGLLALGYRGLIAWRQAKQDKKNKRDEK